MKKEEVRQAPSAVFEGMTSVSAVINGGKRNIIKVLYDKTRENAKRRELSFLRKKSETEGFDVTAADTEEIVQLATGTSHGGIIALCTEYTPPALTSDDIAEGGFYVMLEGIEDPYNFGYALRTLYAAGADGVILSERNWMSAAGVVCRASAGASELLPSFVSNGVDAAEMFRARGYKIICAGIRDSVSAFDADLKKPLFLIVGGEKRGISGALLSCADTVVRLDYGRSFRGSLSAASAASVLAYEVLRQNRNK